MQAGAPSSRIQLLAAGEFPLTLASGNTLQTFASRGAPVDWVPLEPVFVQLNTIMLAAQAGIPTQRSFLSTSCFQRRARR